SASLSPHVPPFTLVYARNKVFWVRYTPTRRVLVRIRASWLGGSVVCIIEARRVLNGAKTGRRRESDKMIRLAMMGDLHFFDSDFIQGNEELLIAKKRFFEGYFRKFFEIEVDLH